MIKVNDDLEIPMSYVGSYGNSLDETVNDGSFDQDYLGGHIVNSNDPGRVTLFGNAWKAFKLSTPYQVTKNTSIKFEFIMSREAQVSTPIYSFSFC